MRDSEDSRRRLYQLGALLVCVAIVVAVAVVVLTSPSTSQLAPGRPVPEARRVRSLFAGIPQHGISLGDPHAPVTLVEYGDLQCPNCAIFAHDALPTIVARYVRTDRVQLAFRSLHFIGGDSLRAARMAAAMGRQNHLWEFADLMYANQGAENSSYVTERYLSALAGAIPGVDVRRALAERETQTVTAQIDEAEAQAGQLGLKGTPSFLLYPTGSPTRRLDPTSLDSGAFTDPIDRLLAQVGATR